MTAPRPFVSFALPVLVLVLSLIAPASAGAAAGDRSRDVEAAQRRANAAAKRYAAAQSALAEAQDAVAELEAKTAQAEAEVDALSSRVREMAVHQYVSGRQAAPIESTDLSSIARGQALLRYVTVGDADDLDRYRAARDDLASGQEALAVRLASQRAAVRRLQADQKKVEAELTALAAEQRAFEAKQAAAKQAAAKQAADAAAAAAARARPASASRGAVAAAPAPAAGGPKVIGSGSWICPVQGARSFSNDWGQPRSGGRRHQGTDILSPRGTPVVASVSGTVRGHNSSLGGVSYYLNGDDGHTYFGTHLNSLSGVSGRVAAGTVVGYVGNSGNASGGPTHLHFEIHPGGGGPVNPYPTLAKYC